MPVKDVVVRAQELGGRWVALGSDSSRGITVEDLNCDADTWGPRSCSFTLRRNPRVPWPDIGAFAPLEIESQGLPVWSGRVKGTPTTDGSDRRITVNGEGWQYHLDDDVYQRTYVQTDLGAWPDWRSQLSCPLPFATVQGTVTSDGGAVVIGWPKGSTQAVNEQVGVLYDIGSTPTSSGRWTITIETSNNTGFINFELYAIGDPAVSSSSLILSQTILLWGALGGATFTVPSGFRYLLARMICGTSSVLGGDVWVRIRASTYYSAAAYESSNASNLKASDVVSDARSKATLLLSSDTSKITTTTFNIPDFVMSKPDTPRNVINAVNTYHNYQARVGVDKLLEYRAYPAAPVIQVDQRSEFDEASAGDASEVYSAALVSYTDAAGVPQTISRGQSSSLYTPSAIQPTNPSATVDASTWTAAGTGAAISRTTTAGEFSTAPGGFKLVGTAASVTGQTSTWTGGAFVAGQNYRITGEIKSSVGGAQTTISLQIVVDGVIVASVSDNGNVVAFSTYDVSWTQPSATTPTLQVSIVLTGGVLLTGLPLFFDNFLLYEGNATVINRRGFRRTFALDTNMSLTAPAAQQIGDVFLAGHKTIPLKGKLTVTGHGTARRSPSGASMPTAELLLNTGELVRLAHLIDPDTGAIGREGRIASVSWDAPSDTVTIEIDSQSTNFEAFLGRLGILTGQVR